MDTFSNKESLLSTFKPSPCHVNVTRRKTLALARYTCYGKHREDVYHMKVLRAYIDEFLEYIEQSAHEIQYALDSLLFWRGQVSLGHIEIPLYSIITYFSMIYVIERPRLLPSYLFFCCAWILLTILQKRSNYPSPLYRSKSFFYHLNSFFPLTYKNHTGAKIDAGEGSEEEERMKRRKKEQMEANQQLKTRIAEIRREMQKFLAALSDLTLHTSEVRVSINPLSRLLPIQLLLKGEHYSNFRD